MSSGSDHDDFDYLEDLSQNEDETLFIPVPPSASGSWTAFYCGILLGITGGGLITLAPWLGALMIFAGYGVTSLTFRGPRAGFSRALGSGFGISSLLGGTLLAIEMLFPRSSWDLIEFASNHRVTFPGIAAMPWGTALALHISRLFWGAKPRLSHLERPDRLRSG